MSRVWSRLDRVVVTPNQPLRLVVAPPPLKRPTEWRVQDIVLTRMTVSGQPSRLSVTVQLRKNGPGSEDASLRFVSEGITAAWCEPLTHIPDPVLDLLRDEPVWNGLPAS